MRLEEVVNRLRGTHTEVLPAISSVVTILGNGDLSVPLRNATTKATMMGTFYEGLTAALYGGDVCVSERLPGSDEEEGCVTPDVVNHGTRQYFEVKSVCSGQHCMLQDYQLEGYGRLLEYHREYTLSFAVYRHTVRGIKSTWKGTASELFQALGEGTLYLVILPYDVVAQMHTAANGSSCLVYRFQKERSPFGRCTSVLASTVTRLFTEPEEILQLVAGEEVSRYRVERLLSPKVTCNGYVVRPFPIVSVEDTTAVKKPVVDNDVPF